MTGAPTQAELDAARLVLDRMGVTAEDLLTAVKPPAPTFAEYVPVVAAAVSDGTRRAYGPYWNRVLEQWADISLSDRTPTDIHRLVQHIKANLTVRRNTRNGNSAAEHLIAALRCLYRHAVNDELIDERSNPAAKVPKPRRQPSNRRALSGKQMDQLNDVVASTGNDPQLDSLIIRFHTETAARRGGALALRPKDLDEYIGQAKARRNTFGTCHGCQQDRLVDAETLAAFDHARGTHALMADFDAVGIVEEAVAHRVVKPDRLGLGIGLVASRFAGQRAHGRMIAIDERGGGKVCRVHRGLGKVRRGHWQGGS